MLKDFFALLFPQVCLACGKGLFKYEQNICTSCIYHLPVTNAHFDKNNPIAKLFWGRVELISAGAFYKFDKGGKVQELIHQLKYKGQKEVGVTIGKLYGLELNNCAYLNNIAVIIPVPLHKKKHKKRGYNQSEYFATGLSESMDVETDFKTLFRNTNSDSQTRKTRFNRWKNVEDVFQITDNSNLQGKHILLVDDVVTTGATLEACAQVLLKIPNVKVSIATIAFASN